MSCPGAEVFVAWVAGQVGGSDRDQLEDHAAGCRLCRGLMLALVTTTSVEPKPQPLPDVLGRYEIRDSSNRAIRAYDHAAQREVAIRVFRGIDPIERERILADAQKLVGVRGIVRVLDSGPLDDGVFIVSEPVVGRRFEHWISKRSRGQRRRALRQVAQALSIMHARGVVHRNVSADNVIVRNDESAALVGFGGAGDESPAADQKAWWQMVGSVMGNRFPYRRVITRGLATGYPSMKIARNKIRTVWPWRSAIGVFVLFMILGAVGMREEREEREKLANADPCRTTTDRDWWHDRLNVVANLAMAGADAQKVVHAIDRRVERTVELEARTCSVPERRKCVEATWHETRMLLAPMLSSDNADVYRAVDDLALVPAVDDCMSSSASWPPEAELDLRLDYDIARVAEDLDRLKTLRDRVERSTARATKAHWYVDLGRAKYLANEPWEADIKQALDLATSANDDTTWMRAAIWKLTQTEKLDAAVQLEIDDRAGKLGNHGLDASLHLAEAAWIEDPAAKVDKLRLAKSEIELVAIASSSLEIQIERDFGDALWEQDDAHGALTAYERAETLAQSRLDIGGYEELMIRDSVAFARFWAASEPRDAALRAELATVAAKLEAVATPKDANVAMAYGRVCTADLDLLQATDSCDTAARHAEQALPHDNAFADYLIDAGHMKLIAGDPAAALPILHRAYGLASAPILGARANAYSAVALHRLHRDASKQLTLARSVLEPDDPARVLLEQEYK
ncbi:MAG: hypothetical protein QM831_37805 [Kofleriaceae bacterium]